MADDTMGRDRDLVLPPNTYAYVLDSTKGKVSVFVGPFKNSLSNTDQLVVWDTSKQRFRPVTDVEIAVNTFQKAVEGQYIVLSNPAATGQAEAPPKGSSTDAIELQVGRQENVPGPVSFPLWPGQVAATIDGHHLRHNQYLIVRVYDPDLAQENWERAVVAPQAGQDGTTLDQAPPSYAMGQLIVVKGTDVSFYIPPTGIEVVPEGGTVTNGINHGGRFVRDAVTLERLEYCILLDENGEKRYVRGPDVVFPRPTESFVVNQDSQRKARAIELNPNSGLFIKVIAEYENHPIGEELFITGKEQAIYFPRAEHSLIRYGDRTVHHAVAIPEGEGRYVLDRDNGTVDLVTGPKMFLPDPRHEVVVLRILDPHIVDLIYPGNREAQEINRHRAEETGRRQAGNSEDAAETSIMAYAATGNSILRSASAGAEGSVVFSGDTMRRGTSFSPPRTITLDTKYEGAVTINIWPGYAVLIVDRSDNRRVEVGPKSVLLEYDETLMPLSLSRGRPKNDSNILRTGYLRIINNQVSDSVELETRDLVKLHIDISYRVNFQAEDEESRHKWFAVENYVKVLTDHCRSRLRNLAKRHGIQEFYTQTIDLIRDELLGMSTESGRPGMLFVENAMHLYDVEILSVRITDPGVADLLVEAQTVALTGAIELSTAEDASLRTVRMEALRRTDLDEYDKTAAKKNETVLASLTRSLTERMSIIEGELRETTERRQIADLVRDNTTAEFAQEATFINQRNEQELVKLTEETSQYIRRMEAINPHLVVALQQFGDQNFVEKLIAAVGPVAMATSLTSADLFSQLFKGTPFEGAMSALTTRPLAILNQNGGSSSSRREPSMTE